MVLMKLLKMQDFELWKKAEAFCDAVLAILARPGFDKDYDLRSQLRDASDSILANMSEGFEQPTDRAFAKYLYGCKGSTAEIGTLLARAKKRGHLTPAELHRLEREGEEVLRMTVGLIKHLLKTPDRRRGLGLPDLPGPGDLPLGHDPPAIRSC